MDFNSPILSSSRGPNSDITTIEFAIFFCLGDGAKKRSIISSAITNRTPETHTSSSSSSSSRDDDDNDDNKDQDNQEVVHIGKKQKLSPKEGDDEKSLNPLYEDAEKVTSQLETLDASRDSHHTIYSKRRHHTSIVKKSRREQYKNTSDMVQMFNPSKPINIGYNGLCIYPREIFTSRKTRYTSKPSSIFKYLYHHPILVGFYREMNSTKSNICILVIPSMRTNPDGFCSDSDVFIRQSLNNEILSPNFKFVLEVKVLYQKKFADFTGNVEEISDEDDFIFLEQMIKNIPIKVFTLVSIVKKTSIFLHKSGPIYKGSKTVTKTQTQNTKNLSVKTSDNGDTTKDDVNNENEIDNVQTISNIIYWLLVSPLTYYFQHLYVRGAENGVAIFAQHVMKLIHTCNEYFKVAPRMSVYNFSELLHLFDISGLTHAKSFATNAVASCYNRDSSNLTYRSCIRMIRQTIIDIDEQRKTFAAVYKREVQKGAFIYAPERKSITDENSNDENMEEEGDKDEEEEKPITFDEVYLTICNKQYVENLTKSYSARRVNTKRYRILFSTFTLAFAKDFIAILHNYKTSLGNLIHPDMTYVSDSSYIFKDHGRPAGFFNLLNYVSSLESYMKEYYYCCDHPSAKLFKECNITVVIRNIYYPDEGYENNNSTNGFSQAVIRNGNSSREINPWAWISNCISPFIIHAGIADEDSYQPNQTSFQVLSNLYQRILKYLDKEYPFIVPALIAASYKHSERKSWQMYSKGDTASSYGFRYNMFDWIMRIPKIFETFASIFSDESIEKIKRFGGNLEVIFGTKSRDSKKEKEKTKFLEEYSAKFSYCSNCISFVVTTLILIKYHLGKNQTDCGGFIFFNRFDTLKRMIEETNMFTYFYKLSKYPQLVYRLIIIILSEVHHQFPKIVDCIKNEARFIQYTFINNIIQPVVNSAAFIASIQEIQTMRISKGKIKDESVDLNHLSGERGNIFPHLYKKMGLFDNGDEGESEGEDENKGKENVEKEVEVEVEGMDVDNPEKEEEEEGNNEKPLEITKESEEPELDFIDEELESVKERMSLFFELNREVNSSSTTTTTTTNTGLSSSIDQIKKAIPLYSKVMSKMNPIFKYHIDTITSTTSTQELEEYVTLQHISASSTSSSTQSFQTIEKLESSLFFKHLHNLDDKQDVPEYLISNANTITCSKEVTNFLLSAFNIYANYVIHPKKERREDKVSSHCSPKERIEMLQKIASEKIFSIYQKNFAALNFLAKMEPTKESTSEYQIFEAILHKNYCNTSDGVTNSIIFTTQYGQRESSFINMVKKMKFELTQSNSSSKSEVKQSMPDIHIVTIESILSGGIATLVSNIKEKDRTKNKKYHNVILDSLHCWTLEECTQVFKLLVQVVDSLISKDTKIYILSNSNTIKDFGYEIVKDISRFLNTLTKSDSFINYDEGSTTTTTTTTSTTNTTKRNVSKPKVSIDRDFLQRIYFSDSKTDEHFDTESRISQWELNEKRFNFIYGIGKRNNTTTESLSQQPSTTKPQKGKKRTLEMTLDTFDNSRRFKLDGIDMESEEIRQIRISGSEDVLDKSLLYPENSQYLSSFLSKKFCGRRVLVIVGYRVVTNYRDILHLEHTIKQNTDPDSELITFYNWCCRGNAIRYYKKNESIVNYSKPPYAILFFAMDDIHKLSLEAHKTSTSTIKESKNNEVVKDQGERLTKDEVKERLCFAINRAIERTTGEIYFECTSKFLRDIYVDQAKDDGSEKSSKKTNYFTGKGQKTSIMFESLCDIIMAWIEKKKRV